MCFLFQSTFYTVSMRHFIIIATLICTAVYGTSELVNIFDKMQELFLSLFFSILSLRYTSIIMYNNTYLEYHRDLTHPWAVTL